MKRYRPNGRRLTETELAIRRAQYRAERARQCEERQKQWDTRRGQKK